MLDLGDNRTKTIQYIKTKTIQYNAIQCNAMQCNAMQYKYIRIHIAPVQQ